MRDIIITRAVLIAGEHTEPGPATLPAALADYLIRQGCALEPDETDDAAPAAALADLSVAKLKALAEADGITLGDAKTKAGIIAAIEAARGPAA
jgi:hypothetical protein